LAVCKQASTSKRPVTLGEALLVSANFRVGFELCLNRMGIVGSGTVGSRGWSALRWEDLGVSGLLTFGLRLKESMGFRKRESGTLV
jgi:hypothetical protein